jgi:predicted amidohydrolase YtcJ
MDILTVRAEEIANARVVMTVFDGRIVYERP